MDRTQKAWNAQIDRLLSEFNITSLWKQYGFGHNWPELPVPETFIIGMHKARYERVNLAPTLREASRTWLEARGYGRMSNLPWPAKGELPE